MLLKSALSQSQEILIFKDGPEAIENKRFLTTQPHINIFLCALCAISLPSGVEFGLIADNEILRA